MAEIPDTPIYCTANAVKSIEGQYHVRFIVVILHKVSRIACGNKRDFSSSEKAIKPFFSKSRRFPLCNLTVYETTVGIKFAAVCV